MRLLFLTILLGMFAAGAWAACGDYHVEESGDTETLFCDHYACNILELNATNYILQRQGVDPVGNGYCYIEVRIQGDKGFWKSGNHENTATIHHFGDVSCESISIGVSKSGPSGTVTCSSDSEVFSTVEGNFQAWCGKELPDERVSDGSISGSCLDNYISCYGWTRASEYGKVDPYEDNPTCWGSGSE